MVAGGTCWNRAGHLARGTLALILFASCQGSPEARRSDTSPHPPQAGLKVAGHDIDVDVFDPSIVRRYEVSVDPDDWEMIRRFPVKEQYIPGKLTIGEQTFEPVAIRFKGSRGSLYGCFSC